jgi:hypothetical protein
MSYQPKITFTHPNLTPSLDPKVGSYLQELQRDIDSFVYNLNKILSTLTGGTTTVTGTGSLAPVFVSNNNAAWQLSVDNSGNLITTPFLASSISNDIVLQSPDTSLWQIITGNDGELISIPGYASTATVSTIILVAPNASRWKVIIADDGSLMTAPL